LRRLVQFALAVPLGAAGTYVTAVPSHKTLQYLTYGMLDGDAHLAKAMKGLPAPLPHQLQ